MYYIGISAYYHESSVFLTNNNGINCFLKEESFSRIKGDKNFPKRCLDFLIKKFDLNEKNIKFISFYEKPFKSWWELFYYSIKNPIQNRDFLINHLKFFNKSAIFFFTELNKKIKISKNKIIYSSHHLSHCLYGMTIVKNFSEYVYLTCDGVGEGETMAAFTIDENYKIKKIWTNYYPDSLGLFYSTITDFLGFEVNEGEFKVMSLSSFGKPKYVKKFKKILNTENSKLDIKYFEFHKSSNKSFSKKLRNIIDEPYLNINIDANFKKYADIACSAQIILEETMENIMRNIIKISNKKKIVLTGGVALNCKMIHNLSKLDFFDELIVPPSPGDSGSAIGAANFAFLNHKKNEILNLKTVFLGPKKQLINEKINKDNYFVKICTTENFIEETVNKIIEGNVIASYYGATEIGPRSLGNTSIFCNAKNSEIVNNLNNKIKKRKNFQPLAPMLLEEDFKKYFNINENVKKNLEWMGCLCDAKKNLYEKYSSIIHIDGTSRTQIINDETSITYKILKELKKEGSEILVNTSFNISKDPVVFDIFDVFVNMKRMDIKFVLMDDGLYQTKNI
ncbi:carbamoyltransferase N-terminal domain-containing protein [Candidatus Pelagibacter sp. HIMB1506]|uniref:carbamoyltransferase N-terminal domain-containing protein n=1 Tax=Candidatus Pelagibacter sp. HIMB1506 TaxID=3413337 RepID=UPI003F846B7A